MPSDPGLVVGSRPARESRPSAEPRPRVESRPSAELGSAEAGWPDGFVLGRENRRALMVLAALPSLSPRRLLETARREGTAVGRPRRVGK